MLEVRSWDNQQDPLLFYLSTIFPPEITWLSDFLPDVLDLIRHRVMQNVQIYLYRPLTGVRRWACAWLIWTSGRSRVILSVFTITINEWLTVFAACTTCLWFCTLQSRLPLSRSLCRNRHTNAKLKLFLLFSVTSSASVGKRVKVSSVSGLLGSSCPNMFTQMRAHTHTHCSNSFRTRIISTVETFFFLS